MPMTADHAGLDAEDAKLVTLARSARARAQAAEGAAVRDHIGRTYVAVGVELSSLRLSALQAAVAAAISSGQPAIEAVAVVGTSDHLTDGDRALLSEMGVATVVLADPDGSPRP